MQRTDHQRTAEQRQNRKDAYKFLRQRQIKKIFLRTVDHRIASQFSYSPQCCSISRQSASSSG